MKVTVYPSKCNGKIKVPPSKSIAHRSIICASLANGRSILNNIAFSQDILATIEGMCSLGASIIKNDNQLIIEGIKDFSNLQNTLINCSESGSTLRFFIPIFSLTGKTITFVGKNKLLQRPQNVYADIFNKNRLYYFQDKEKIKINGCLKSGTYTLKGDISSQFITGLMFALPLLEGNSIIKILPPFESKSYVQLTIDVLKSFGINIEIVDEFTFFINGNQKYTPTDYTIEGDFSQLAFFAVLGAINNTIECTGVNPNSNQGDRQIIDILRRCHIDVVEKENGYIFHKGIPCGTNINLENCPDLGPILTILASFGKGSFVLTNAKRLRFKESDRILAMEMELKKLGIDISSDENNIFINDYIHNLNSTTVSGHKDHRIVMSLAIAGTLLNTPITISGAEAIEKSYPNFFSDLKSIGIKLIEKNS